MQSSEAMEKHQGCIPEQATKGAVMVEVLRPQSVPIKTVHNTELVATKHQKCPEDKGNKPRIPRIEIKRKRIRNGPLLCQMPCSDRGIYEVKNKRSHRPDNTYYQYDINKRVSALGWRVGRRNREENLGRNQWTFCKSVHPASAVRLLLLPCRPLLDSGARAA